MHASLEGRGGGGLGGVREGQMENQKTLSGRNPGREKKGMYRRGVADGGMRRMMRLEMFTGHFFTSLSQVSSIQVVQF